MTLRETTPRGRTNLVLRGALLILLEQLFVDPVLYGQVRWVEFGVLSTLGVSMVVGALLSSLDSLPLAAIGAGLAGLSQIAPLLALGGPEQPLWAHLLLLPGGPCEWFVLYPLLPWLGVVVLGMAFGRLAATTPSRAYRLAGVAGVVGLAGFVLLRSGTLSRGWIAFLSVVKYPPALDFLLLTLGANLSVLWLLSRISERWLTPLVDFGRSALVFYLLHWHVLALLAPRFRRGHLGPMYAAWVLTMMVMYPICVVWGRFRQELRPGSPLRLL